MNEVIAAWQRAFEKANGGRKAPLISYNNGWYTLTKAKYRKNDIQRMTRTLLLRTRENENKEYEDYSPDKYYVSKISEYNNEKKLPDELWGRGELENDV